MECYKITRTHELSYAINLLDRKSDMNILRYLYIKDNYLTATDKTAIIRFPLNLPNGWYSVEKMTKKEITLGKTPKIQDYPNIRFLEIEKGFIEIDSPKDDKSFIWEFIRAAPAGRRLNFKYLIGLVDIFKDMDIYSDPFIFKGNNIVVGIAYN